MCFEAGYAAAANSASAADLRFLDEETEGDADKQGLPPICTGILTILRCCVSRTPSAEQSLVVRRPFTITRDTLLRATLPLAGPPLSLTLLSHYHRQACGQIQGA
jgi:hypothetical protein